MKSGDISLRYIDEQQKKEPKGTAEPDYSSHVFLSN